MIWSLLGYECEAKGEQRELFAKRPMYWLSLRCSLCDEGNSSRVLLFSHIIIRV